MRAQLPFHINSFEALLCNQAAVPQARLEKLSGHQVPYPCGKGFWRGCRRLQLGVPGPWVHSWGITVLFLYFCMLFFFFFFLLPLDSNKELLWAAFSLSSRAMGSLLPWPSGRQRGPPVCKRRCSWAARNFFRLSRDKMP